jgi:hypothetical protein
MTALILEIEAKNLCENAQFYVSSKPDAFA